MTPLQSRQSDLITVLRESVTQILDARASIKRDRETFAAATAGGTAIDPASFADANADLDAASLAAALAAFNAIEALLTAADGTPTATLAALLKLRSVR